MSTNISLTNKQRAVLLLLGKGRTLEEIGDELGMSRSGAKNHADVLRRKFGVKKARQLVEIARGWE